MGGFIVLFAVLAMPPHCEAAVAARHVSPHAVFTSGIVEVERFGNRAGRSIVFIPALFCGSWQWNAQINDLSDRYDVLVVTLPGFDARPAIAGDALMQRAAASLHHLIVAHDLRRPVVVGHSLGGTLAVYFAEHYPHDATSVVTVEGGYPIAPTQAQRDAAVAKSTAPYANVAKNAVGRTIREQTLQYTITSEADVEAVEPLAARSDPAAIVAWMRAALLLDLTPGLSKITVPFTAIIPFDPEIDPYEGYKTLAAKRAAYDRWVARAPDGEVVVIDHSRHFVMFDQPREFESALEAVIAR
jgi:pimeloyl-ACP methyl ester carboxylesterase